MTKVQLLEIGQVYTIQHRDQYCGMEGNSPKTAMEFENDPCEETYEVMINKIAEFQKKATM